MMNFMKMATVLLVSLSFLAVAGCGGEEEEPCTPGQNRCKCITPGFECAKGVACFGGECSNFLCSEVKTIFANCMSEDNYHYIKENMGAGSHTCTETLSAVLEYEYAYVTLLTSEYNCVLSLAEAKAGGQWKSDDTRSGTSQDFCEGINCSGYGKCKEQYGKPTCDCDTGYHADGVSCVPDETEPVCADEPTLSHKSIGVSNLVVSQDPVHGLVCETADVSLAVKVDDKSCVDKLVMDDPVSCEATLGLKLSEQGNSTYTKEIKGFHFNCGGSIRVAALDSAGASIGELDSGYPPHYIVSDIVPCQITLQNGTVVWSQQDTDDDLDDDGYVGVAYGGNDCADLDPNVPDCSGQECGGGGCADFPNACGNCGAGSACENGFCGPCVPNCAGMQCGNGGCADRPNDTCGVCGQFEACEGFQCISTITPTWTDSSCWNEVGTLTWENPPQAEKMTWPDAVAHCEGLALGDFTDWRLPTLKELRSLIEQGDLEDDISMPQNCGAWGCEGGDFLWGKPLGTTCFEEHCIYDHSCTGGMGPGIDGCYWPLELLGVCGKYYSSSPVEDVFGAAFVAQYLNGSLDYSYYEMLGEPTGFGRHVRCVRGGFGQ